MKIFFEVDLELFTVFNDLDNPNDFYVHSVSLQTNVHQR